MRPQEEAMIQELKGLLPEATFEVTETLGACIFIDIIIHDRGMVVAQIWPDEAYGLSGYDPSMYTHQPDELHPDWPTLRDAIIARLKGMCS